MVIVQTSQNTHLFAFVVITAVTCRLMIRIEIRIMVDSFFLKRFYFISDTILNPFHFAGNQTVHRGHLLKRRFLLRKKAALCPQASPPFSVNAVTPLIRPSLSGASFSAAYMFFVSLYKEKTLLFIRQGRPRHGCFSVHSAWPASTCREIQ